MEREDLQRLRAHTASWTLAQDAALAKVLESFSARLESRIADVTTSVDSLGLELERAQVRPNPERG